MQSESVVQNMSVIRLSAAGTAWLLSSTGNPAHSENSLNLQNPSPGRNKCLKKKFAQMKDSNFMYVNLKCFLIYSMYISSECFHLDVQSVGHRSKHL